MRDQPLVHGCEELVLRLAGMCGRRILVSSLRKNNHTAERLVADAARCIVQRCRIHLNHGASRYEECLYLCRVIVKIIGDILLFSEKKNQIILRDVDLG